VTYYKNIRKQQIQTARQTWSNNHIFQHLSVLNQLSGKATENHGGCKGKDSFPHHLEGFPAPKLKLQLLPLHCQFFSDTTGRIHNGAAKTGLAKAG